MSGEAIQLLAASDRVERHAHDGLLDIRSSCTAHPSSLMADQHLVTVDAPKKTIHFLGKLVEYRDTNQGRTNSRGSHHSKRIGSKTSGHVDYYERAQEDWMVYDLISYCNMSLSARSPRVQLSLLVLQ